ncbi:flagellar assembly protein FliH [Hyalangium rubrum]|uniref:Flagellar assembly protein FliH n=1 Tax=Hyalangium rubrum TaxID=3103134 RepID=A0ABU5GXE7_9BACT|nr:flagellar assembly protein FliH [Hyalangium sp. s54d21]MDY7225534.1 flagellar assembly protein FliH [Hyalangium sp. s54d21]
MPPYRLQTLMEMRARAKEEAEQAFSEALKALEREKAEQKRLEEDLERRKAERKQKVMAYLNEVMAKGAGINGMNMMSRFEQRLKDEEAQVALDIERQKEVVKVAERTVERKRELMAEAAKELKAIEKHKETWQKQVKHERQQREELNQEEIGSALFQARQRK